MRNLKVENHFKSCLEYSFWVIMAQSGRKYYTFWMLKFKGFPNGSRMRAFCYGLALGPVVVELAPVGNGKGCGARQYTH